MMPPEPTRYTASTPPADHLARACELVQQVEDALSDTPPGDRAAPFVADWMLLAMLHVDLARVKYPRRP